MSMLQRLEVTDQLTSRGDTIDVRVLGKTLQAVPQQRPLLQALAVMWRLWGERRAARRALAMLDTRTLRDIGIAPELVDYELSRWSWQPLLDWHAARYVYGIDMSQLSSAYGNSRRPRLG